MIKKKSEAELTKSRLKAKYRNFWTSWRWIPGRSPKVWVDLLQKSIMSKDSMLVALEGALVKLELEKKITNEQNQELCKMLESKDSESQYLAVSIMEGLAPKRFKRRIKYTKGIKVSFVKTVLPDGTTVHWIPNPAFDNIN